MGEPMGEPEPEPLGEPMGEPLGEPMGEPMGEPELQPTGLENEFKTVPGVQAPEPMEQPQEEDDVLFGDAPEQRTKNPRYN